MRHGVRRLPTFLRIFRRFESLQPNPIKISTPKPKNLEYRHWSGLIQPLNVEIGQYIENLEKSEGKRTLPILHKMVSIDPNSQLGMAFFLILHCNYPEINIQQSSFDLLTCTIDCINMAFKMHSFFIYFQKSTDCDSKFIKFAVLIGDFFFAEASRCLSLLNAPKVVQLFSQTIIDISNNIFLWQKTEKDGYIDFYLNFVKLRYEPIVLAALSAALHLASKNEVVTKKDTDFITSLVKNISLANEIDLFKTFKILNVRPITELVFSYPDSAPLEFCEGDLRVFQDFEKYFLLEHVSKAYSSETRDYIEQYIEDLCD